MTEKILNEFKKTITSFDLVPSDGGCFEITVDGDLMYSKLATGEFPDESSILKQLSSR